MTNISTNGKAVYHVNFTFKIYLYVRNTKLLLGYIWLTLYLWWNVFQIAMLPVSEFVAKFSILTGFLIDEESVWKGRPFFLTLQSFSAMYSLPYSWVRGGLCDTSQTHFPMHTNTIYHDRVVEVCKKCTWDAPKKHLQLLLWAPVSYTPGQLERLQHALYMVLSKYFPLEPWTSMNVIIVVLSCKSRVCW